MGWEQRHGRLYLYRNRRVDGRPRKEYLAPTDPFGFGEEQAYLLGRLLKREARVRELRREAREHYRERLAGLLAALDLANAELRTVAEATLVAFGYHRHHRGDWRKMRSELKWLKSELGRLKEILARSKPLVDHSAPDGDFEAVELFAKARSGDEAAKENVRILILARGWVDRIGDLGEQSTRHLVRRAAGRDPVWVAAITEKAEALRRELLGDNPTALEGILARRVVNSWVMTHALELELSLRLPSDPSSRRDLDRALTRAQKRLTDAARELTRVRCLNLPVVFAQVNVVGPPNPPQLPVHVVPDVVGLSASKTA
jgi:hypothetical protein